MLNKIYAAKPALQEFEGTFIAAVKWAEKFISDTTPNKGMHRLDEALKYSIKVWEEAKGKKASKKVKDALKDGLQITHEKLEANGTLKK